MSNENELYPAMMSLTSDTKVTKTPLTLAVGDVVGTPEQGKSYVVLDAAAWVVGMQAYVARVQFVDGGIDYRSWIDRDAPVPVLGNVL